MGDDVDAPCGIDLDGDVDMEWEGDDDEEEDEAEEDDEDTDEDEEEDENEDDGKGPWMIGQGEIVTTSADDVDTMLADRPIVLHEQGQEMGKYTPWPQPPAPAPWPNTLEPRSQ